jgi:CubicO group peptidase (beta-lactamase class C family)
LQMVEEGVLSLDDTVTTWLNDPAVLAIPNVERITLWQLLHHTSGIYDYADENDSPLWSTYLGETPDWSKVWTNEELLAFADGANHPPYFEPGQSWAYSNTAYMLLGMIIEQATANHLADEIRNRVFVPLSLTDTFLAEGAEIPEGTTDCYQSLGGELVNVSEINLSWTWACGWTVSTMADFARFGRAILGSELVSPASFQEQFTFVPDPRFVAIGWGMGVWSQQSAYGQVMGMGGDGPGFTANLARLVTRDVTVAILLNSAGTEVSTGEIRDQVLGAVIEAS